MQMRGSKFFILKLMTWQSCLGLKLRRHTSLAVLAMEKIQNITEMLKTTTE